MHSLFLDLSWEEKGGLVGTNGKLFKLHNLGPLFKAYAVIILK